MREIDRLVGNVHVSRLVEDMLFRQRGGGRSFFHGVARFHSVPLFLHTANYRRSCADAYRVIPAQALHCHHSRENAYAVIPAEAGIHLDFDETWIPAFAGMTRLFPIAATLRVLLLDIRVT